MYWWHQEKRVVQLGINVRYMVIVILPIKIEDILKGANINLEIRWHGKFSHDEEQGYTIIHDWEVCDLE